MNSGGGLEDIVKLTTYLTERSHLEAFRRVRNRFFRDAFPPNTLLFVSGLAHPDYLVEIEARSFPPFLVEVQKRERQWR